MDPKPSSSHNARNLILFCSISFLLFLVESIWILSNPFFLRSSLRTTQLIGVSAELAMVSTVAITAMAIPLGFGYMFFFGGVASTRAMKLYLFLTRGKTVITGKSADLQALSMEKGWTLKLKRQVVYFAFILAVVISFAIYVTRHAGSPIGSPSTSASDLIPIITQDYIIRAIEGSLMVPVVALALPYFGGLRLRTIDVGPFHTTILTFVVGASGGFTLLYTFLTRPEITFLFYYLFLFMGACWCFAFGCNLAADPANRQIVRDVLSGNSKSKLVSSKIWIENPPGKLVEI